MLDFARFSNQLGNGPNQSRSATPTFADRTAVTARKKKASEPVEVCYTFRRVKKERPCVCSWDIHDNPMFPPRASLAVEKN